MLKTLINRLLKLLEVKSIVTLGILWVFMSLAFDGKIPSEAVISLFSSVISFFFGMKIEQRNQNKTD